MAIRKTSDRPWKGVGKVSKGTKKYKNQKVEAFGLKFDSKTEMLFYKFLTGRKIKFEYQKKITLTPPTLRKDKDVLLLRERGYTQVIMKVDFVFELHGITYYLDTKGSPDFVDPVSKLKYRLLAFKLKQEGLASKSRIKFIYMDDMKNAMYKLIAIQQGEKIFL